MITGYTNKAILGTSPVTKKTKTKTKPGKTVAKLLIVALLWSVSTVAFAQKESAGTGESFAIATIRGGNAGPAGPPVMVTNSPTAPSSATGMTPTKLEATIKTAYGFLVGWGRGGSTNPSPSAYTPQTPIVINALPAGVVGDYTLILPAAGFQFASDHVRILKFLIQDKTGRSITGPASLMLNPSGQIVKVVVPTP